MEQIETLAAGTVLTSPRLTYRIVSVLGRGGFGITYLANGKIKVGNVWTEGFFAIKEHFPANYAHRDKGTVVANGNSVEDFARSRQNFISEAQRLQKLGIGNANIVKVNEVFVTNGTAYYVMQYINGKSLTDYVVNHKRLSFDKAVALLMPVMDAVEYLHGNRMNHLDVKPDNIMLHEGDDGLEPVLIDFGLCVHFKKSGGLTSPKSVYGVSEGYSPIEQYAGIREFTPEADIYSLAATLIYMLTGKTPEGAADMNAAKVRGMFEGKLNEEAVDGICRAMRKDYTERPSTVGEFKRALGLTSGGKVTDEIVVNGGSRRNWKPWVAGIAGAAVGITAVLLMLNTGHGQPSAALTDTAAVAAAADSVAADSIKPDTAKVETPPAVTAIPVKPEPAITDTKKPQNTQKPTVKPEDVPTIGTLDLGYATWRGAVKKGKPYGSGTMEYHSTHRISHTSVEVHAGEYLKGTFDEGGLISGKLYDSAGNLIQTIIP